MDDTEREEAIEDDLRGIYQDEEGAMPDLSILETPKRSWRNKGLLLSVILLLLTAGIGAWFFFAGGLSFRTSDYLLIDVVARPIEVEEERAQPLVAGTPSRIAIRYQNIASAPLASLSLRLNLPSTLIVDRFVPEPTQTGNTWELGNLKEGSDGLIEIYGTLLGDVPSIQKLQMVATYRPANFSSEFDEITVVELPLETSALSLEASAPDTTAPGEDVELTFELLNPSRSAVVGVELAAILPDGFRVSESQPPIEEGLHWNIPRMEAHSKATFTLRGTMSADTRGLHDVGGRVFLAHEQARYLQVESLRSVDVHGGALATSVIVNGAARDQNVDPGTLLRVSIPIENASEASMEDVELELLVEAGGESPIDWENSGLNLGGGSRVGETILWSARHLEELEELDPGESVTIDLTLPLFEAPPETASDTVVFTAVIGATSGTNGNLSVSTTPITLRLNSLVRLYTSALYHDTEGNVIGSGPLPPRVGEATTYAIIWSVASESHAVENLVIEAELPTHVQFAESIQTSTGALSYRVDGRKVRWEVASLEGSASARFNVSVTPGASDVGSLLKLTNQVSLSAKDGETGSLIRREGVVLTTALRDDAFAQDDGVVIE